MRVGPSLSTDELMLLNCGAREDSWELDGKEIKLVNPKGNQPWICIERTDDEDAKSRLTGKDLDAGKD